MDTNKIPKQALQYKPKGRRNIGRPRKRWRDQLHFEDQGRGITPNPSWTWWWWWLPFNASQDYNIGGYDGRYWTLAKRVISDVCFWELILVAARSEAWVCGRSLLELRVRISPGEWMSLSCKCCMFSCRGFCDGLITHPEESYRVSCAWVRSWSLENEAALAHWRLSRHGNILF